MPRQFNPNTIEVLYAPRMRYAEVNKRTGKCDTYTGVYFPTQRLAEQAGDDMLETEEGRFADYDIVTVSASMKSLFETYRKALEGGTVVE